MTEPAKTTALPPTYDNPLMAHSNFILVAGLVIILTTLIVPLPTYLLDMLIACSLSLAVAVMVITLSAKERSSCPHFHRYCCLPRCFVCRSTSPQRV